MLADPVPIEPGPDPVPRYELLEGETLRMAFARWAERERCELVWLAKIDYPVIVGAVIDADSLPVAIAKALLPVWNTRRPLIAEPSPSDGGCPVVVREKP